MSNSRSYERHELFRALTNSPLRTTRFRCSWIPVLLLTVLAPDADATPIHSNAQNHYPRRNPPRNDQSLGPKIWVSFFQLFYFRQESTFCLDSSDCCPCRPILHRSHDLDEAVFEQNDTLIFIFRCFTTWSTCGWRFRNSARANC